MIRGVTSEELGYVAGVTSDISNHISNRPKGGDLVTISQSVISCFPEAFKAGEIYRTTTTIQSDLVGVIIEDRVYPMSVYNLQKATEPQIMTSILNKYEV